jgi:hypothetical protein
MITTPCYGNTLLTGFMKSFMGSARFMASKGHRLTWNSFGAESLITRGRNNLAAQFLGSKQDLLMFIDADITWQPQALLDLVESGYQVCGIPYPTKSIQWERIAKLINEPHPQDTKYSVQKLQNLARIYTINPIKQPDSTANLPQGWMRVNALGAGFMLIQRGALESMRDYYWETLHYANDVAYYKETCQPEHCVALFDTMIEPDTRRYLSEDYAFCRRWRDMGGEIYACTKHRLVHVGMAEF